MNTHFRPEINMKRIALSILSIVPGFLASAQTATIGTVEVCAGQEVLLPVTGAGLTNVGAVTLYIGFDTLGLTYTGIENVDPQLTGMSMNMMGAPTQLAFAWSSTIPVNFTNTKLFDIRFSANGQPASVGFNPGCEIADPSGTSIPVQYENGAILTGMPLITIQPSNTIIPEGDQARFTVEASNALTYRWRESQDQGTSWLSLEDDGIYSGTHSPELTLYPVPFTYTGRLYQCLVAHNDCQISTTAVILQVGVLSGPGSTPAAKEKALQVTPVPFRDHADLSFEMPCDGEAVIRVISGQGTIVSEKAFPSLTRGHHHITWDTSAWHAGAYSFLLIVTNADSRSNQSVKTIKNN